MIEKKGDLDDLMLICKLVKPDGSTCNKSTKLNQVENGVIKIKYANTRAHLLTHGPSVMLTSAEAAEARKVLAELPTLKCKKPSIMKLLHFFLKFFEAI